MWIVAKALHTSPLDKSISDLSTPQFTWILSNHYKDREEEFEKLKILCRFINPDIARKVFDREIGEIESESDEDEFMKEVREHSSKDITTKDVKNAFEPGYKGIAIQDLDTIERVEDE